MTAVLLARYRVEDRARFLEEFDAFEEERVRAGAVARALLVSDDDPGVVVALIEFPTREAAGAFARGDARREALARASVVDRAEEILEVARPWATGPG